MQPTIHQLLTLGDAEVLSAQGERLRIGRLPFAVLTYLAMEGRVTRSYLLELFWNSRKGTNHNLNTILHRLRSRLPPGCVEGTDRLVWRGAIECDALTLRRIAGDRNEPGMSAIQLYKGDFLEKFVLRGLPQKFVDWVSGMRVKQLGYVQAVWRREIQKAEGNHDWEQIRWLGEWGIEKSPHWEDALWKAMEAHLALNRPEQALTLGRIVTSALRKANLAAQPRTNQLLEHARQQLNRQPVRLVTSPVAPTLPDPAPDSADTGSLDGQRPRITVGGSEEFQADRPYRVQSSGSVARTPLVDIFLAAPMDAFRKTAEYASSRATVLTLKQELQRIPGCERIFYAGDQRVSKDQFNDPTIALRENLRVLRSSRMFVMIHPRRLPTSTVLELGMALMLKIPGIIFVHDIRDLPYLARGVTGEFPEMLIRTFVDLVDLVAVFRSELERGNLRMAQ